MSSRAPPSVLHAPLLSNTVFDDHDDCVADPGELESSEDEDGAEADKAAPVFAPEDEDEEDLEALEDISSIALQRTAQVWGCEGPHTPASGAGLGSWQCHARIGTSIALHHSRALRGAVACHPPPRLMCPCATSIPWGLGTHVPRGVLGTEREQWWPHEVPFGLPLAGGLLIIF